MARAHERGESATSSSRRLARTVALDATLVALLLGPSLVAFGCAKDLDALRPLHTAEEAVTETSDGAAASGDAGARALADASALIAPPTTPDTAIAHDAGMPSPSPSPSADAGAGPAPTCGVVGLACCMPGNTCERGACLRGRCSAFGGSFVAGCALCGSRNPYTAGCSCPFGFDATSMSRMTGACGASSSDPGELVLCTAPRAGTARASDFAGAYVTLAAHAGCAGGCLTPNPLTGGCACSDGTAPIELDFDTPTACGDGAASLVLCATPAAPALTFAGAYQWAASGDCAAPNPVTGTCACPSGTTTTAIDASPEPFYLCTR